MLALLHKHMLHAAGLNSQVRVILPSPVRKMAYQGSNSLSIRILIPWVSINNGADVGLPSMFFRLSFFAYFPLGDLSTCVESLLVRKSHIAKVAS